MRRSSQKLLREYIIYKITNNITQKCYVGWTINLKKRTDKHFRDLRANRHHSTKLQRAFNKYGMDAFDTTIVEKFTGDLTIANEREIEIISLLNSYNEGYNCTPGGGGNTGHFKEKHWNRVEVHQYDVKGNFINTFSTKKEAYAALIGNQKDGSIQFKNSLNVICRDEFVLSKEKQTREALCNCHIYDLDGKYVDSFYSAKYAGLELGLNNTNIMFVIDKPRTLGNFQWRSTFKESIQPIKKQSKETVRTSCGKAIMQFDLDDNLINEYQTQSDAVRCYGESLLSCLRGVTKTAYGYKWKFKN